MKMGELADGASAHLTEKKEELIEGLNTLANGFGYAGQKKELSKRAWMG